MNPLESIELRLRDLLSKRTEIDREVSALQEARDILMRVSEQPLQSIPSIEEFIEAGDVGITDAVRGALRLNYPNRLTALQIRNVVESHGFALKKYRNAMATIHQVLKRLVEDSKQVAVSVEGDEKFFQWIERPKTAGFEPAGLDRLRALAELVGPASPPKEFGRKK
jgi:hypothetical protein